MSKRSQRVRKTARRKCRKCKAFCDGKPGLCSLFAEGNRFQGYHRPSGWPMKSKAAGVHRDQIPEAMASDKKLGVPIRYQSDGQAIFENPGQRYSWMKAHGMHDNNGGYRG